MINQDNVFLRPFSTPHSTYPFDKIKTSDLKPAILEGIREEDEEIKKIVENKDVPTFENTVVAMEKSGSLLDRVTTVMYNLLSADTNDELDALSQEMAPVLSEHSNNIMLNERLFERIKYVNEHEHLTDEEDKMLMEKTYTAFERSGAALDKGKKQRFREITAELSKLALKFSQNNLKETNNWVLHVEDKRDLEGLPEMQIDQAASAAAERGEKGWVFTLHAPSYVPFMTYASNRGLRKQMYMAYNTKCTKNNQNNNFKIVSDIVNLRRELAQLLGYSTYADFVLKKRMAENVGNVDKLVHELIDNYKGPAKGEVSAVEKLAKETEGEDFCIEPWDFSYYSHKLQKKLFDIDAEMLRPYFELSKVKEGVFGLATRLYGITFKENTDIPVYHPDVKAYEVFDKDGSFLAVLYADFHPRKSKQGGAWMTNYKEEWDGTSRPHVSIVMNLTKPTENTPSLLTLGEVETFLHEFGHALHGIFASTKYRSLSGTNVYWDFVELPSQFMENYAVEREFLLTFARHYKTGEPLPDDLIKRIVDSRNFNAAYACMRQVSFILLDMAYYTKYTEFEEDVRSFEKRAWKDAQMLPQQPDTCMSVQFGHIMSGGYAAGYYSYKWAEVLDADAFSMFKENGIFDKKTAERFRNCILSKGGTRPPMELYEDFRGHKPTIDALLERNGIKKNNHRYQ